MKRVKENETLHQTDSNRVTTSAIEDHMLILGIEIVTSFLLVHAHIPLRHSVSSQHDYVSSSYGDDTYMLSTPHLKDVDIETGGH